MHVTQSVNYLQSWIKVEVYPLARQPHVISKVIMKLSASNIHFEIKYILMKCHDTIGLSILDSGERLAKQERSRSPLMYTWHDKHYVGAAHGIVGILFMLLQVSMALTSRITL